MSMKESQFKPGETLYAGAFEVDGIETMIVADKRTSIVAMAMKMGVAPGTIDIRKFKTVKVVEV